MRCVCLDSQWMSNIVVCVYYAAQSEWWTTMGALVPTNVAVFMARLHPVRCWDTHTERHSGVGSQTWASGLHLTRNSPPSPSVVAVAKVSIIR